MLYQLVNELVADEFDLLAEADHFLSEVLHRARVLDEISEQLFG